MGVFYPPVIIRTSWSGQSQVTVLNDLLSSKTTAFLLWPPRDPSNMRQLQQWMDISRPQNAIEAIQGVVLKGKKNIPVSNSKCTQKILHTARFRHQAKWTVHLSKLLSAFVNRPAHFYFHWLESCSWEGGWVLRQVNRLHALVMLRPHWILILIYRQ